MSHYRRWGQAIDFVKGGFTQPSWAVSQKPTESGEYENPKAAQTVPPVIAAVLK
jgi:hypothetical protein